MTDSRPAGDTNTSQTEEGGGVNPPWEGLRDRTCVVDLLCEVDSLPVGQPPVDGRPRGWSQRRVESVDVEAQVDRPLLPVWDGG